MRSLHRRIGIVALALVGMGCGIPPNDPLPGFGQRCVVTAGSCDVDHVCRPDRAGGEGGICVPVETFGNACPAPEYAPGRRGEEKDDVELVIDGPEDLALLEDLRVVTGQVRVFKQGVGDVEIGDLCAFRTLQKTGDGLGIGDSTLTSLDGLQSVTAVERGVAIFDNRSLTDVAGLANLVSITPRQVRDFASFDLILSGNTDLGDAAADAFLEELEARVGRPLDAVVCNNGGRVCDVQEQALLDFLVANGLAITP